MTPELLLDPSPVLARQAPQPLTVLVADDHALFRRGLARAVERHPLLRLVGEASDGDEALELIDALEPDVAVLDHRMPGLTGVEVCAQLNGRLDPPRTALLLLSAFEDGEIVASAVSAGAAGYIGKSETHAGICAAIERLGGGGIAFTETTEEGLQRALDTPGTLPLRCRPEGPRKTRSFPRDRVPFPRADRAPFPRFRR